jgi:phosphoglycerate kinase
MSKLPFLTMDELDLRDQRVLIREDLNVPMENGKISSQARIEAAVPTLKNALQQNARVIILSHLGRPREGTFDSNFSLAPVAQALSTALDQEVPLIKNWLDGVEVAPGNAVLCENVRFNFGENANDPDLSKRLAMLCDIFVMDAFATAHRAQASTMGVAQYAPQVCAGPLLVREVEALSHVLDNPKRPLIAIIGGSKVSTKLQLLENLIHKVDQLVVGGGIANTFLAAKGIKVGKSLYESNLIHEARRLIEIAQQNNVIISLPVDVAVAKELSKTATADIKELKEISPDDYIFDVGPKTTATYPAIMHSAGTIVWNGPVGVFENDAFSKGTEALVKAITSAPSTFSIAGGGETIAALEKFKLADKISYLSTAGGAFLEFLEGKTLPGIAVLEMRARL